MFMSQIRFLFSPAQWMQEVTGQLCHGLKFSMSPLLALVDQSGPHSISYPIFKYVQFKNWKSMQIWALSIEWVGKWKVGLDQPTSHWNGRMQWMSSMNEAILHPRRKRRRSRWAQLFEGQFSIFECLHEKVLVFSARWTRVGCIRLVTMAAVTELGNGMWFLHWFTNSSS